MKRLRGRVSLYSKEWSQSHSLLGSAQATVTHLKLSPPTGTSDFIGADQKFLIIATSANAYIEHTNCLVRKCFTGNDGIAT